MVKRRAFIINNKLKGNTHEIIDASLIISIAKLFDRVELYLSTSRCAILTDICSSYAKQNGESESLSNCNWHGVQYDLKSDFLIDIYVALIDAFILLKGKKKDVFIFSYGNSRFSLYVVNFLSRLLKRNVVVCAHNELDVLVKEKYPINPNWFYLINRFYRKTQWSKNIRFLVLGDFIIDNLRKTLPADRIAHFYSVDHPYFQTQQRNENGKATFSDDVIKVGLVGTVAPNKGLENLEAFVSALDGTNVELCVISRVVSSNNIGENSHVKLMNPQGCFLSREKYDELVSDMDYLFFPYPKDRFCFSVSGSIFESIAKRKPFIAFRNDHFSYLIRKFGEFGLIVDNVDQLDLVLKDLSNEKRYGDMVDRCGKISEKLSPYQCDIRSVLDFPDA